MTENKSKITVFRYCKAPISFSKGECVMVSATQMAKPFKKEAKHWLINQSTKDFIKELANVRNLTYSDLVIVKNGSPVYCGGTWMHEDVALEFARWLSPAFTIWCNDRIKELLSVGMTALPSTIEELIDNPDLVISLATQLKQLRAEKAAMQRKIDSDAPKVMLAEAVSESETDCYIGELAKILCQNGIEIGQNRLFNYLRDNGYIGKSGSCRNVATQRYIEMGLFRIVENNYTKDNGRTFTSITTYVTGKGRQYFIDKFLNADKQ